jgi:CHASE1-domain containing sensor protein
MSDEAPESPDESALQGPEVGDQAPAPKDDTVGTLLRVAGRFMVPFLFSFALAFVGSQANNEVVYFAGLIGVGVSMLVLLVWLIH